MLKLRPATLQDEDALYAISLKTGDSGEDATSLYGDGRMVGHIYSVPYLHLNPDDAYVVEDGKGVCGYIVGALDTALYEERLEWQWWPALRAIYADPQGDPSGWNADQKRAHIIHHPPKARSDILMDYPAHIHMNLLPRTQGQGGGTAMLARWLDMARQKGVKGIHLGASPLNEKGMGFWQSRGFARLDPPENRPEGAVWFGMRL
jgi:GNAT superfamily N-acetyltransferase